MSFLEPARSAALRLLLAASALLVPACWLEEPAPPPTFDCASIDRAEERFPIECSDAGMGTDAAVTAQPAPSP